MEAQNTMCDRHSTHKLVTGAGGGSIILWESFPSRVTGKIDSTIKINTCNPDKKSKKKQMRMGYLPSS